MKKSKQNTLLFTVVLILFLMTAVDTPVFGHSGGGGGEGGGSGSGGGQAGGKTSSDPSTTPTGVQNVSPQQRQALSGLLSNIGQFSPLQPGASWTGTGPTPNALVPYVGPPTSSFIEGKENFIFVQGQPDPGQGAGQAGATDHPATDHPWELNARGAAIAAINEQMQNARIEYWVNQRLQHFFHANQILAQATVHAASMAASFVGGGAGGGFGAAFVAGYGGLTAFAGTLASGQTDPEQLGLATVEGIVLGLVTFPFKPVSGEFFGAGFGAGGSQPSHIQSVGGGGWKGNFLP